MMKNSCDRYLQLVKRNLPCGRKLKNTLLRQIKNSLEDFADEHGEQITMDDIIVRFGTPIELSDTLAGQITRHELKRMIAAKRTMLICVLLACAIALAGILSYIIYDHKRKEAFENGYVTEVLYTYTVDVRYADLTQGENVNLNIYQENGQYRASMVTREDDKASEISISAGSGGMNTKLRKSKIHSVNKDAYYISDEYAVTGDGDVIISHYRMDKKDTADEVVNEAGETVTAFGYLKTYVGSTIYNVKNGSFTGANGLAISDSQSGNPQVTLEAGEQVYLEKVTDHVAVDASGTY